ncbi:MAG: hypothetical protein EOM64_08855 [Erysipelotrichia bacterium]|nr:hypothetical protein [Erysipelotrichia bacterium]
MEQDDALSSILGRLCADSVQRLFDDYVKANEFAIQVGGILAKTSDALVNQAVTYAAATADNNIDGAAAMVQDHEGVINGIAMTAE